MPELRWVGMFLLQWCWLYPNAMRGGLDNWWLYAFLLSTPLVYPFTVIYELVNDDIVAKEFGP